MSKLRLKEGFVNFWRAEVWPQRKLMGTGPWLLSLAAWGAIVVRDWFRR